MKILMRVRGPRPRANWSKVLLYVLAVLTIEMAVDVYGLYRTLDFGRTQPTVNHVNGILWVDKLRKHGTILRLNTAQSGYEFSCDFAGLGGSNSCDFAFAVKSFRESSVDWISAPHGVFNGTLKFPIAIEQGGRWLFRLQPSEVAAMHADKIESDLMFFGTVFGVVCLSASVIALRCRIYGGRLP